MKLIVLIQHFQILCYCCLLFGCGAELKEPDLVGQYVSYHLKGKEVIDLYADNTCLQWVYFKPTDKIYLSKGQWKVRKETGGAVILFSRYMSVFGESGYVKEDFYYYPGKAELMVCKINGCVVILSEEVRYWKRHLNNEQGTKR